MSDHIERAAECTCKVAIKLVPGPDPNPCPIHGDRFVRPPSLPISPTRKAHTMKLILAALAAVTFGLVAPTVQTAQPVEAAHPAAASQCYPAFVSKNGVIVGGRTYCAYPSPWQVWVGCAGRGSTTVIAIAKGPIFYSSPSYAYCPAKAPSVRYVTTHLPNASGWARVHPAVSQNCYTQFISGLDGRPRAGGSGYCTVGAFYVRVGCAPNAKYQSPTIYYYGPTRPSYRYGPSARFCPAGAPYALSVKMFTV